MKNLKFFLVICLLTFTGSVFAQTSTAFKNAAYSATSSWNNKNLKCNQYAKALDSFLSANASSYGITSYKFYEIKAKNGLDYVTHDDYTNGGTAISTNGKHVIVIINGEVWDNHHPKGSNKSSWESKLYCQAGGYPGGFITTQISNIQSYN